MGKLYIVPTPIGNLEDMTFRAVNILKKVDVILAEDTRKTIFLLKHYQIQKRVLSHHKFNEHKTVANIVQQMQSGVSVALVSDAGTPAISDPGYLLVRECVNAKMDVICLPGATAFIPALVVSGLPNDRFCFEGFLPHKKGRQKRITELVTEMRTMIFYESPYRILKALEQMSAIFGADRNASVSRELTKMYENTQRGSLEELVEYFKAHQPKGEFVIIVEGAEKQKKPKKYDNIDS